MRDVAGRFRNHRFFASAVLPLIALALLASCSLKPKDQSGFVTIRFSKGSTQSLSRQVSRALSTAGSSGAKRLAFTDFTCFGIQVAGSGVSGDSRLGCAGAGGILAGLIPATGGDLEVLVPVGAQRTVRVFALKSTVGCPSMDSLAALPEQTRFTGLDTPYEIGSTTLDIFHDVDVTIQAKFDPAAPVPAFPNSCGANGSGGQRSGLAGSSFVVGEASAAPQGGICNTGVGRPCLKGRFTMDSHVISGVTTGGTARPSPGPGRFDLGLTTTDPEKNL